MKGLAFFAIGLLAASGGFAAETPRSGDAGRAALQMEELEVRGLREKPEVLYLPVQPGIGLPTPVRYDLFLEDMARPVLPAEILPGAIPAGRTETEGANHD